MTFSQSQTTREVVLVLNDIINDIIAKYYIIKNQYHLL